jgi:hypothetical protein
MQTGSSGTLIGWKSGQTTFVPLWDQMEGAWLRTLWAQALVLRVSSKQTKKNFGSNRNKICFSCVSVCFVKQKTNSNGLFRFVSVFQPISKQPKQTELFCNKSKQTKTTLNFRKITKYALFQTVWVGLPFVSVQSKHRNSLFRYRSETTKINCFETNRKKNEKTGKNLNFLFKIALVRRCNGTTARLGYWKVGLEWLHNTPPGQ